MLWHGILKVSGRLLNPQKCMWFMFHWKFLPSEQAQLIAPTTNMDLYFMDHSSMMQPIWLLCQKEVHCYLGIQITADGNHKQELQLFRDSNNCYTQLFLYCPLTHHEACLVYLQCYLPTVSYPLPATSMPTKQLLQFQGGATAAILSKMGYPQTFPQVAAYASP